MSEETVATDEQLVSSVECEECGKVFTGQGCRGHLAGHKKSHEARRREMAEYAEKLKNRVPFGMKERKFNVPENDGFHYRVFNDNWTVDPGRIQRALKAGYEIVNKHEDFPAVGVNDNGTEIRGVLMRIPKEIYEQDQKAKQKEVDKIDQKIKGGSLEQGSNDKRYSRDGIKIWDNNTEKP